MTDLHVDEDLAQERHKKRLDERLEFPPQHIGELGYPKLLSLLLLLLEVGSSSSSSISSSSVAVKVEVKIPWRW